MRKVLVVLFFALIGISAARADEIDKCKDLSRCDRDTDTEQKTIDTCNTLSYAGQIAAISNDKGYNEVQARDIYVYLLKNDKKIEELNETLMDVSYSIIHAIYHSNVKSQKEGTLTGYAVCMAKLGGHKERSTWERILK